MSEKGLTVRFPVGVAQSIEDLARVTGTTPLAVVERAIDAYAEAGQPAGPALGAGVARPDASAEELLVLRAVAWWGMSQLRRAGFNPEQPV